MNAKKGSFSSTTLFSLATLFTLFFSAQGNVFSKYSPLFNALTIGSAKIALIEPKESFDARWESQYKMQDNITPESAAEKFLNIAPEGFFIGPSQSHYQIEGGIGSICSCDRFYNLVNKCSPGDSLQFWNNPWPIIDDVAAMGASMFRISLSWERLQPNGPESWDQSAMDHYRSIIQYIKSKGVEPLVVFHHYTVPTWFEDLDGTFLGGFVDAKNNHYFVDFAVRAYENLADIVTYWSTYNMGYEFKAYRENQLAPGNFYYVAKTFKNFTGQKPESIEKAVQLYAKKHFDGYEDFYVSVETTIKKEALHVAHLVKANILLAHADIYEKIHALHLKKVKNGAEIPEPQIGIQVTIHPLYPHSKKNPFIAAIGNWMLNHGFYEFFTNDQYDLHLPTKIDLHIRRKNAHKTLDWVGINVYDRSIVASMKQVYKEKEEYRKTAGDKTFCPQVIAYSVEEITNKLVKPLQKKLGKTVPIIITENGLAAKNDQQRNDFYRYALYTIQELIKQGHPIIGYLTWSSHDNFEWGKPYKTKQYGLFEVYGFETGKIITALKDPKQNYFVRFSKAFTKK